MTIKGYGWSDNIALVLFLDFQEAKRSDVVLVVDDFNAQVGN